jgi:hypothetical protein
MKNLTEMTIPELKRECNKNYRTCQTLERRQDTINNLICKKRLERCGIKKNDIIAGKAIVFNKMRKILAKVDSICESYDIKLNRDILKVMAYTPGEKRMEFDIAKTRLANVKEIQQFKYKTRKYEERI